MGLSAQAIDSVFNSMAYAETALPAEGKDFEGTGAEVLIETVKEMLTKAKLKAL